MALIHITFKVHSALRITYFGSAQLLTKVDKNWRLVAPLLSQGLLFIFYDVRNMLTNRQVRILGVLLMATLCSSFAVCLFPPFFPRLAEEKGASAATYGFVIGTNCLTSFIVTPLIGKNVI
jgi:hypothetical protein